MKEFYFLHDHPQELKLMEDDTPVHCSSLPLQWRQAHGMEKLIWPANYPHLNPIENQWKIVKDLLQYRSRPKNKEKMAQTMQSTWDTISLEQLQNLIRTMPDRMQAVILARGGSI